MIETKRPINIHKSYHAHVYFDNETLDFASNLCEQIGEHFGLKIGRVHQKMVGPHPQWSCQIIFASEHFDEFIPWLNVHRNGLTIFVHAVTDDDLKDHTDYAYWLGKKEDLKLSIFTA